MTSARQTLAQQLKELHEKTGPTADIDPENAYSSLSTFRPNGDDDSAARIHYAAVGNSRLRDTAASTFAELDDKYAGSSKPKSARVKIFDDDLSDDDEAAEGMTGDNASRGEFDYFGESSGGEESFADEDEDEEDDEDDDVDDFEGEEPEDDESEDGTDGNDEDGLENGSALTQKQARPTITSRSKVDATGTSKAIASHKELDPLASLKSSKAKEVEKGLSIRKQQRTFDELLTARINIQKAWASGSTMSNKKRRIESMEEEDVWSRCVECLQSLGRFSDQLLNLRAIVSLKPSDSKKRKVDKHASTSEYSTTEYWRAAATQSFELIDSSHDVLASTLEKWSSKIQAAAAQQASMGKSSTKFSNVVPVGIAETIANGLASRERNGDVWQDEDPAYKALLREVIESRSGSGAGNTSTPMQSEKKKRRDAERGASKGRKIRYTVHEKAQNFVVPIPLSNGWHQEQIDELFTSLLGGAGVGGAGADREDGLVMGMGADAVESENVPMSGLRVF